MENKREEVASKTKLEHEQQINMKNIKNVALFLS